MSISRTTIKASQMMMVHRINANLNKNSRVNFDTSITSVCLKFWKRGPGNRFRPESP